MKPAEKIGSDFYGWFVSVRDSIGDGKIVLTLRAVGAIPHSMEYSAYAPDCSPPLASLSEGIPIRAWTRKGARRKLNDIVEGVREFCDLMKAAYKIPDSKLELRVDLASLSS